MRDTMSCDCIGKNTPDRIRQSLPNDEFMFDAADFFKMFGDSTRIKILYTLLVQEMCVGAIADTLDMTQSAVSHQLKTLRRAGLIKCRKNGKESIYSLDDEHVSILLKQGLEHIEHRRPAKGREQSSEVN